jgi:hypothetical protein
VLGGVRKSSNEVFSPEISTSGKKSCGSSARPIRYFFAPSTALQLSWTLTGEVTWAEKLSGSLSLAGAGLLGAGLLDAGLPGAGLPVGVTLLNGPHAIETTSKIDISSVKRVFAFIFLPLKEILTVWKKGTGAGSSQVSAKPIMAGGIRLDLPEQ